MHLQPRQFTIPPRPLGPLMIRPMPGFRYSSQSASKPCASITTGKGERKHCPLEFVVDRGRTYLRLCETEKEPGRMVPVSGWEDALCKADDFCRHWTERGVFKGASSGGRPISRSRVGGPPPIYHDPPRDWWYYNDPADPSQRGPWTSGPPAESDAVDPDLWLLVHGFPPRPSTEEWSVILRYQSAAPVEVLRRFMGALSRMPRKAWDRIIWAKQTLAYLLGHPNATTELRAAVEKALGRWEEADKNRPLPVIIRVFQGDAASRAGENTIAIFPTIPAEWDTYGRPMESYMRVGGHGAADYHRLTAPSGSSWGSAPTRKAKPHEVEAMLKVLREAGYDNNMRVYTRLTPELLREYDANQQALRRADEAERR